MNIVVRLTGLGFAIGLLFFAIVLGGSLLAFFSLPSVAIVLGVPAGLSCFWFGGRATVEALCAGLAFEPTPSASNATVLQGLRTMVHGAGGIGFFIGLVQMLQSMDDPSKIGPAMAVALLTVLYALCLGELALAPMQNRLSAGLVLPQDDGRSLAFLVISVVAVCGMMVLMLFSIV